jgi:hypothetical protein
VVSGLLDASKYRFRVAAVSTTAGQGDFSAPVEARTRSAYGDNAIKLTPRVADGKTRLAVRDVGALVCIVLKVICDVNR